MKHTMKKRVGALLLSLVMVLSMTSTAFAALITPAVSKTTLHAGEEVDVTLNLDETLHDITCFEYYVYFDEDVFDCVGKTNGVGHPATQCSKVKIDNGRYMEEAGKQFFSINYVDPSSEGQTVNAGVLYTLTFRAKEDISTDLARSFRVYKESLMDTTFEEVDDANISGTGQLSVHVSPAVKKGFTASLSPAQQSVTAGAQASVHVDIDAAGYNFYNAALLQLTYDAEKLTFNAEDSQLNGYAVRDNNGSLQLAAHGDKRGQGNAVVLAFDTKSVGEAKVQLTAANVDIGENATTQDAPAAALGNAESIITVSGYPVSLPVDFTGAATAAPGEDYTFTAKDLHYDYSFTGSTMGGQEVSVRDNGDGTFTVANVTGALVIRSEKKAQSYDVTVSGDAAQDVTAAPKAVYAQDYTFSIDKDERYSYSVSMTIGGRSYTGFQVKGNQYTIPGADVTGAIAITVSKTVNPEAMLTVTFEGTGAGDASGEATVLRGTPYTFTIRKAPGYDYQITATAGGTSVDVAETENGYTIAGKDVTGNLVITVAKTAGFQTAVSEYVKLDGQTMFLVTVSGTPGEGKTFAYDGVPMFYSSKYEAYCYLVISREALTQEAARENVSILTADTVNVSYAADINGTGLVDVNDAQMVYNMYNADYPSFEAVSMAQFLAADQNGSRNLTVEDSAAIISQILNNG